MVSLSWWNIFLLQVVVFQTYTNQSHVPIEAKYVFPLDDKAAVCGFEAFINGKHIVGEVSGGSALWPLWFQSHFPIYPNVCYLSPHGCEAEGQPYLKTKVFWGEPDTGAVSLRAHPARMTLQILCLGTSKKSDFRSQSLREARWKTGGALK